MATVFSDLPRDVLEDRYIRALRQMTMAYDAMEAVSKEYENPGEGPDSMTDAIAFMRQVMRRMENG